MCLAIPGKVVEIKEGIATIDYDGVTTEAKPVIKINVGDKVLVQNKLVVEKLE